MSTRIPSTSLCPREIDETLPAGSSLWSKFVAVRDGSRIRLPTTTLSNPLSPAAPPSRTRLSRSLSTSSSLSSNSSDDNEDELLPFTSSTASTNSARYASFQRKSRSMVESLRDNVVSAGGSVVQSLGWNDSRGEDGVGRQSWKRLLMGTRDVDREMGGIRLGAESDNLFELGGDDEEDATSPNFGSPSRKR